ncbi:hypothetical protein [Streptomyces sp. NPDC015130]|uniref:hypothetical protein n=1 Tax=Streptomyces sp. NPDC015130 TaxID=3364940 RepID=UPI0037017EB3
MLSPNRLDQLVPGTFAPGTFDSAALTAVKAFQNGEAVLPGPGTFPVTGVVAELSRACLGEHVPQA